MARKLKDQPSFFKILITENYYRKLRLPSLFVEQYRNILPEDAKFRISSGETWDVRLERMDDDDYYFTQGWRKFAKDLELQSVCTKKVRKVNIMAKNSELTFSFYTFLYDDDFISQLEFYGVQRLPPQFMKVHGENLSEKAKLHVESEELHSPWIVKIERVGQWHFFTDGWTRFARDIDLKFREFLLFKLVGESTFEVSAYDISGCEKELYSVPRTYTQADDQTNHANLGQRAKNSKKKAENENEDVTNDQTDGEILSLVKKLTKADAFELKHYQKMNLFSAVTKLITMSCFVRKIPRGLAMSTGIVRNKKLKLKYGKGQKWPIYVSAKQCGKFAITWGWNEFLTGNKMVIGSMISLEFVGNEIEAKVLKKGINGEIFDFVKKKRGRRPKLPIF
ncbi:hypothetical protein BUALT_BualtUnG0058600 [Buddleja alternifolia]|uniref:TF-B3 domain-containing protein n=1 Tax=Buddleja alternifolia TaxID=168488 RepID=A0AAV6W4R8_9LAMI|nr:hypothetical protein BUALT_BualtUnG0058600 [Buddleja alternifolia]